ncbi:MAG: mechanosensitive ion channel family protein [Candidatus Kapaibacterium sp.]|nr:mechanosensitive ion channel family protein [Ignavibacteriota bacterium]MCB9220866.1 mechanosensitive ion channel family protein [Ignavibacteria bacterium]
MKNFILITLFLLLNLSLLSQNRDELTSNPRKTIETHLKYLQQDNYRPELSALTLNIAISGNKKSEELAKKLKRILDERGLYVVIDNIPDNANYKDKIRNESVFIPFKSVPEIYLRKVDGNWLYSKETVNNIEDLYSETFPLENYSFKNYIPDSLKPKFLGMAIWKYFGLLIFLLLSLVLYRIVSWIIGYFLIKILRKILNNSSVIVNYINPISNPISFLIVISIVSFFLPLLEIPIQFNVWVSNIIKVLYPITLTMIIYRSSDLIADFYSLLAAKTETTVDDNLIPLVRKVIKIIIVILGLLYSLSVLGVEITPLLAGASVGGLALALAAQDTLKNFFGSITIYTDSPFEIGDWIVFDGGEGVVEEIRVRSTRIRTFHNSVISVPNGILADLKIDNMGRRRFRRFRSQIGLTYDTPPDLIDAYITGLREIVKEHPKTKNDPYEIHLNEFGTSSLNILVYIFFEVENWSQELKARQEFMLEAIRLAKELNVRFAFPTSTLHIEEMPGEQSLTPSYSDNRETFFNKAITYVTGRKSKYKEEFK